MDHTRRIILEGVSNARELGGLVNTDGQVLRRGALIRSANLSRAAKEDEKKLKEVYHLSLVIDLRTPMAAGQKPDVPMEGVRHLLLPVFDDAMIGVTHENDRDYVRRKTKMPEMKGLYEMMVLHPACRARFGEVLRIIMAHDFEQGSVLWHCSEGKDRCGLVTAFLLSAQGVSDEQILEDYLITNETNLDRAAWYYRQVLENGGSEEVAASVRDAFVVKEEYLRHARDVIRREYPEKGSYLTEGLGLSETILQEFKNKMLQTR